MRLKKKNFLFVFKICMENYLFGAKLLYNIHKHNFNKKYVRINNMDNFNIIIAYHHILY